MDRNRCARLLHCADREKSPSARIRQAGRQPERRQRPQPAGRVHWRRQPAPKTPPLVPLGRRLKQRVARGRDPIEARIDLHGHTQKRGSYGLFYFLQRAQADGARMVLVVTGKGAARGQRDPGAERGVLKRQVPMWLSLPEFRSFIVGFRGRPCRSRRGRRALRAVTASRENGSLTLTVVDGLAVKQSSNFFGRMGLSTRLPVEEWVGQSDSETSPRRRSQRLSRRKALPTSERSRTLKSGCESSANSTRSASARFFVGA